VVPPPIIRSANNYLQHLVFVRPLLLPAAIVEDLKLFYLETALHVSGGNTTHHQERKQLYLQHRVLVTTLMLPAAIVEELEQVPDTVDTVVCAPDDGWWYHPKHVEQFPDKINCVMLRLVGHILEYDSNNLCYCIIMFTYYIS
jgi:hypothetical protein